MAVMRPLKSLSVLSFTPIILGSACRISSPLSQPQKPQCATYSTSNLIPDTFSYRIAASFSAKGRRFDPKGDLFSFNHSKALVDGPYAGKRPNSGQDAFFVGTVGNSANVAFGVTDGVGGWSDSGIDSADFSHGLCGSMADIAKNMKQDAMGQLRASDLLQRGYDKVVADKVVSSGGSTACIAVGMGDGTLQVANLGDSGFIQLRPNAVYYSSKPQTHAFNTPYQLSIIPPKMLARMRAFGSQPLSDEPRNANVTNHKMRHGDVLVFATDGVWDNLSSTDLLKLVSRNMIGFNGWAAEKNGVGATDHLDFLTTEGGIAKEYENSLQAVLAVAITGEAKMASMNTKLDGPFAREVQKYYPGEKWHGGKIDDICVVVAIVVENQSDA